MAGVLVGLVDTAIKLSSTGMLESLWREMGASALTAAAGLPSLLALLDQHGAAVRDALSAGAGMIGIAALAGYARGLLEIAKPPGKRTTETDWTQPGWLELRLAAVCALARQYGHLPAAAPA